MARMPRLHVPGGLYHVLARGNNRQEIFRRPADYRFYLGRLGKLLVRTGTRCFAYCLMPNHLHLLLEPGKRPLSRIMQPLQLIYSQYFNRVHRHTGHVFQGRYAAILCEQDAYLLELVRYLHLNPVRAGLTKSPGAWEWSSHRAYLGTSDAGVELHRETVLGLFGKRPARARQAFSSFVRDGMGMGHRADLYEVLEQRVLGSDAFAEGVLRRVEDEPWPPVRASVDEILDAAATVWKVDRESLRAPGRARQPAQARTAAAYLAREIAGKSLAAIARAVRRDVATLSHGVRRLEAAKAEDSALERRLREAVTLLRSRITRAVMKRGS